MSRVLSSLQLFCNNVKEFSLALHFFHFSMKFASQNVTNASQIAKGEPLIRTLCNQLKIMFVVLL